ncbi:MAG: hypothetical protein LBT86_03640 [Deltaproteobacteria bacterium]|jgi:hypothetical protein|nr:hypothetical protein [Deltaproteobacteria bacterium]
MSTENTHNLTGPTLDPRGSDDRLLSDRATEIVERLRKIEAALLARQTNGQKSIAKENELGAKAAQKDQNVDIEELSSNIFMFKWFGAIIVAIICGVGAFSINYLSNNIISLSNRVDGLSNRMDSSVDGLSNRMDSRVDGLSNRMDSRVDGLSNRMDSRVDGLSNKMDSINSTLFTRIDVLAARINKLMKMVSEIRDERVKKLGESTRPDPVKDQTPSRAPAKN